MTHPPAKVLQLDALTGLRGLAAWLVVVFHTRVALVHTLPPWLYRIADKGYLAVDLFFILSGFVLWHAYGERLAGQGLPGALRFWWRRLARIWPLHAVMLGGCVALALVLAATGRDTSAYPWQELPLHILLIQNWGFTPRLSWNDPAWSISCEMAAYLLFPALVAIAPWPRLRISALLAVAAGLLGFIALYFGMVGAGSLTWDVPHTGLARCLPEFMLGMMLRLLWPHWHDHPLATLTAWAACLIALALGRITAESAVAPIGFAALILALAFGHGWPARLLASPPLRILGEISYATYLAHYLLFTLFKLAFVKGAPLITIPQLGAYLALVLGASFALYHAVEKPAQRRLNALLSPPYAPASA